MRHPEPQDYIKAYNSGFMSEQMMLDLLINYEYTFGYVPIVGGQSVDAYVSGTFDQVESAYYGRRLTRDQFETIFNSQRQALREAARDESRRLA